MTFHRLIPALMLAAGLQLASPAAAQENPANYPSKPIQLIVPYGPGGSPDVLARLLSQGLSDRLKQPMVVMNRPGATGLVGSQAMARSAADGYTLAYISAATLIAQVMSPKPVVNLGVEATIAAAPFTQYTVLLVQPSDSVRNVKDLIQYLKARPGKANFSSGGTGTPAHLAGELFQRTLGLGVTHVPYKQLTDALLDVMRGEVQYIFSIGGSAVPLVKSGKLRALAVAAPKRLAVLPDVPTMKEAAGIDIDVSTWNAVIAPAATPAPLLQKLHRVVYEVIADPKHRKGFEALGVEIVDIPYNKTSEMLRSETVRWASFVKEANIKQD